MIEVIEINYISPMSDYVFDNKLKKYYIVIINSSKSNTVIINKLELSNIENVSDSVRSYFIGKGIQLLSKNQYPFYSLKLFEQELKTNKIKLLFTGSLNLNDFEYNGIKTLVMYSPSKVIGDERSTIYKDETSFLEEQFYNFESHEEKNKCILFMTRIRKSDKELIKPYIFKFDLTNDKYIYDRYNANIIKEQPPINFDNFCKTNTFDDYIKFVKLYNIDTNRYSNKPKDSFKSMLMRKINLNKFRPLNFEPYMNNMLCSPVDGRVQGFTINGATKFKFNDQLFHYKDLVTKPYELLNGGGFINRMAPSDYQRVHMPYAGYLKEISIHNHENKQYYISLRFESDYFVPPSVHEREYISVIYGNNIQMSRGFPELVEVQPETKLVFHVLMFGNSSSDSVAFTNTKLVDMKKSVNLNTSLRIKPIWFEQAEEIGTFNCCNGNTVVLVNRPIDFTSDIKFYSKMEKNDSLYRPIETYVRLKDVVGLIL